jgi:hypothetical protein
MGSDRKSKEKSSKKRNSYSSGSEGTHNKNLLTQVFFLTLCYVAEGTKEKDQRKEIYS